MNNHYFLLRHGEALSNQRLIISCWPEKFYNPLTKKGEKQTKKASQKLKKENIDLIFSSDLNRTRQAAEIVSKELNLPIYFDKRLREINSGIFKGRPIIEYEKIFSKEEEKFSKRPPKGESWNDVRKRMLDFLKELEKKHKNKNILIISHGDPLWLLEGKLRGFNQKDFLEKGKAIYPKVGELRKLASCGS